MLNKIKNPDVFGEVIRDLVFKTEDEYSLGGYSTFELEDGFSELEPDDLVVSSVLAKLLDLLVDDYTDMGYGVSDVSDEDIKEIKEMATFCSDGSVWAAWYWDGDGVLAVSDGHRFAINTDCKKDSGWRWVK